MTELTQQQMALLEQYYRAHAAMNMAVNFEDFHELVLLTLLLLMFALTLALIRSIILHRND